MQRDVLTAALRCAQQNVPLTQRLEGANSPQMPHFRVLDTGFGAN